MTTPTNAAGDGVHELVRQRDQLRAWIAKLDEVQAGAPSRVTQRVRADYEDRLRRVTGDLSAHGEEIRRGLDEQREQLAAAEERRAHAGDALEETRLRHLIGELDEGAWDEARQPLEAEAAAADEAVAQARAEVDRLSTLSTEIAGDDAARAEADEGEAEPAASADGDEPTMGAAEDEDASETAASTGSHAAGGAPEDEPEWGAAPRAAAAEEEPDGVSGEDLAAWITEVEAEVTSSEATAPREDESAEGWDPFPTEFGGGQASPATQPGDAARELPWLDSLEGAAAAGGKWAAPPEGEDELAFLENLDAPPPAADAAPAADLAEDDLAFLEELDRAISGGTQRPGAPATPAAPTGDAPGLGSFVGGSGDGPGEPADITEDGPKRGEALLCKECGAINEPQAWYCEICGSEL
ncbi:MAG TPA: hypothetical protein VGO40_18055 [Longimicrobium sp.]|jgi:hypothetical protein|nr:hypothetical protein [Longimicrobium sp.]